MRSTINGIFITIMMVLFLPSISYAITTKTCTTIEMQTIGSNDYQESSHVKVDANGSFEIIVILRRFWENATAESIFTEAVIDSLTAHNDGYLDRTYEPLEQFTGTLRYRGVNLKGANDSAGIARELIARGDCDSLANTNDNLSTSSEFTTFVTDTASITGTSNMLNLDGTVLDVVGAAKADLLKAQTSLLEDRDSNNFSSNSEIQLILSDTAIFLQNAINIPKAQFAYKMESSDIYVPLYDETTFMRKGFKQAVLLGGLIGKIAREKMINTAYAEIQNDPGSYYRNKYVSNELRAAMIQYLATNYLLSTLGIDYPKEISKYTNLVRDGSLEKAKQIAYWLWMRGVENPFLEDGSLKSGYLKIVDRILSDSGGSRKSRRGQRLITSNPSIPLGGLTHETDVAEQWFVSNSWLWRTNPILFETFRLRYLGLGVIDVKPMNIETEGGVELYRINRRMRVSILQDWINKIGIDLEPFLISTAHAASKTLTSNQIAEFKRLCAKVAINISTYVHTTIIFPDVDAEVELKRVEYLATDIASGKFDDVLSDVTIMNLQGGQLGKVNATTGKIVLSTSLLQKKKIDLMSVLFHELSHVAMDLNGYEGRDKLEVAGFRFLSESFAELAQLIFNDFTIEATTNSNEVTDILLSSRDIFGSLVYSLKQYANKQFKPADDRILDMMLRWAVDLRNKNVAFRNINRPEAKWPFGEIWGEDRTEENGLAQPKVPKLLKNGMLNNGILKR
jgi:hypothetical protein